MKNVIVNTSDDLVKEMLLRQSITLPLAPAPPFDTSLLAVNDQGYFWIVIKFFDKNDPRYAAYGIPENSHPEEKQEFVEFIIAAFSESADLNGIPELHKFGFQELLGAEGN